MWILVVYGERTSSGWRSERFSVISTMVMSARVNAGSLFVALQRLERIGLIRSEWKVSENNRRAKYYLLSERGRKRLNTETREWGRQVAAIARILEA